MIKVTSRLLSGTPKGGGTATKQKSGEEDVQDIIMNRVLEGGAGLTPRSLGNGRLGQSQSQSQSQWSDIVEVCCGLFFGIGVCEQVQRSKQSQTSGVRSTIGETVYL